MTIDMGIIPILFHVIQKSRDARIRMDAISLLEAHPRLEALWDGPLVAKVGRVIDKVERQGPRLENAAARGFGANSVPSWARVQGVILEFAPETLEVLITCMRGQDYSICHKQAVKW